MANAGGRSFGEAFPAEGHHATWTHKVPERREISLLPAPGTGSITFSASLIHELKEGTLKRASPIPSLTKRVQAIFKIRALEFISFREKKGRAKGKRSFSGKDSALVERSVVSRGFSLGGRSPFRGTRRKIPSEK